MSFTNDELRQLKNRLASGAVVMLTESAYDLTALIARLEAAELLAECLSNHEDLDPVEVTEIGNWRKAAGRV